MLKDLTPTCFTCTHGITRLACPDCGDSGFVAGEYCSACEGSGDVYEVCGDCRGHWTAETETKAEALTLSARCS
jgi:DnaJ-class molecular chaperone